MLNSSDDSTVVSPQSARLKPANWLPNDVWMDSLAKQISSGSVIARLDDKVLVVKATYKDYWTFPGGVVDDGESPSQAASRELYEEVGLRVSIDDLNFSLVTVGEKLKHKVYQFMFETSISQSDISKIKFGDGEIEAYQLLTPEQILSNQFGQMSHTVVTWASGKRGYYEFN